MESLNADTDDDFTVVSTSGLNALTERVNRLQAENVELRRANAELRLDSKHYFDALMDVVRGRRAYPYGLSTEAP
jgi:hypothetical protein